MDTPAVGDGAQFLIAFRRQLQYYVRTWRFVGLLAFVAIVSSAVLGIQVYLGVGELTSSSNPSIYLSNFLSFIGTVAVLVAAFLGGDAIAMDFGSATGYYLLVQPVRRTVLLLGRFAAAAVAAVAIGAVYLAFGIGGTIAFFGPGDFPTAGLALAVGLLLLLFLGALAVAFFFSALFRTPAVSLIVTILTLWLGFSTVSGVLELANIEPWFSILYAGDAVPLALRSSYPHTIPIGAGIPGTLYQAFWWESAAISLGYFVVFLLLSILLYDRKEVKG